MANPQVLIEIKTIGADKAVKSTDRITVSVEKAEKATAKFASTAKRTGETTKKLGQRTAAEMGKANLSVERMRGSMEMFSRAVKKAGGDTQLIARVTRSFNANSKAMLDNSKNAEKATAAQLRFQTVLQRAKNELNRMSPALKKVSTETRQLGRESEKAGKTSKGMSDSLKNLSSSAVLAIGPLSGVGARIVALGAISARGGLKIALLLGTLTALAVFLGKALKALASMESQLLKLETVLIATGNASGATVEQIDKMAVAFGKLTLNSISAGREIFTIFASFGVPIDQMERAARAAEGLGAVLGTDTVGAARRLALSFQDPSRAAELLRRTLGTLDESLQRELIALDALGLKWKAFELILNRFDKQFGKAAENRAKGLAGAANTLSDAWDDLLDNFFKTGPVGFLATTALNNLTKVVELATGTIKLFGSGLLLLNVIVAKVAASITEGLEFLFKSLSETSFFFSEELKGIGDFFGGISDNLRQFVEDAEKAKKVGALALQGGVPKSKELRKDFKIGEEIPKNSKLAQAMTTGLVEARKAAFLVNQEIVELTGGIKGLNPEAVKLAQKFGVLNRLVEILPDGTRRTNAEFAEFEKRLARIQDRGTILTIFKDTRTDLEKYNEQMKKLNNLLGENQEFLKRHPKLQMAVNKSIQEARTQLIETDPILNRLKDTTDDFADALTNVVTEGEQFGRAMKKVLQGLLKDLLNISLKQGFNDLFNSIFNTAFKGFTGTAAADGGKGFFSTILESLGVGGGTGAALRSGSTTVNSAAASVNARITTVNTSSITIPQPVQITTGTVLLSTPTVATTSNKPLFGILGQFLKASQGPSGSGGGGGDTNNPSGTTGDQGVAGTGETALTAQHGLDFRVGGSGGTDSQHVNFMATPGEQVSVKTPSQQKSGGNGGTTIIADLRGADKGAVLRLERLVKELDATLERRAVNATVGARQANPRLFEG